MKSKVILRQGNQTIENGEVEWYSGSESYSHPERIKIKGVWEDVFQYEKKIRENLKRQREIVFRCHIGDNRIIVVVLPTSVNHKG
ncbi:MAG: hypothetical protein WBE28_09150 [bacterium]